jgi:hypothetical protein
MCERKKYDFERLQNFCNENNVVLLEDYTNKNLQCHFFIKGICSNEYCSNIFTPFLISNAHYII